MSTTIFIALQGFTNMLNSANAMSLPQAHKGIADGKERDDYIETARRKAHDLKEYTDRFHSGHSRAAVPGAD